MKIFKLPDLGEGLPDAIIREWYVKEGDEVNLDQPLVAMETAKALVDVPSPFAGKIEKLFGSTGDTIETGQPLVGFEGEGEEEVEKDTGTVVGAIEESGTILKESAAGIPSKTKTTTTRVKATPAVRALARKLSVDLEKIQPKGNRITAEEVKAAAKTAPSAKETREGFETLSPARRAMALSMTQSHQQVVPVSLVDDADIHSWETNQDFSIRIIRAISAACHQEPMLNAHFDGENQSYKTFKEVNIGVAVDTPHGLFTPVLFDVDKQSDNELREKINAFKQKAKDKTFSPKELKGATILFSNFGTFAGRYANPIITPPLVAIVAAGRSRHETVVNNDQIETHKILPLSLTFDHRLATGGEAARFLKTLMEELQKPTLK